MGPLHLAVQYIQNCTPVPKSGQRIVIGLKMELIARADGFISRFLEIFFGLLSDKDLALQLGGPLGYKKTELLLTNLQTHQPDSQHRGRKRQRGQTTKRIKPIGTIEMRLQDEVEGNAVAIPMPLIAGAYAETVGSRRDVCVVGVPRTISVHPVPVIAFQLILESEFLRIGKAGSGELKVQISAAWGTHCSGIDRDGLVVDGYVLDDG